MQRYFALVLGMCLAAACARAESYVVLPFFNTSHDASINWIGESIAETVGDALASDGLVTIGREDRAEAYQRLGMRPYALLTKAAVIKLGEELDAEHVIYGSFDLDTAAGAPKTRGSLQIKANLLDLKRMRKGSEYGEVGALEDLASLQHHLAWKTLQYVSPGNAPTEAAFAAEHPAIRVDAIENYVRGLLASTAEEKTRLFTQAARLDPRFSQACFQLGKLYTARKEYKTAIDWLQKVTPADVHYREATFYLGLCRYYAADFAGAQSSFEMLASHVPLNEVFNNLGVAQARRNLPQAVDALKKAIDGDPSDPVYQFNLGYVLWKRGDFDRAAERFRLTLERSPDDQQARTLLARSAAHSGPRPGEVRMDGLERVKSNYEESAWRQLKAALQKP